MPAESGEDCSPRQSSKQQITFSCSEPLTGRRQQFETDLGRVSLYHAKGDPEGVNRLRVQWGQINAEILPSKGFSVGQVACGGNPIFWEPPLEVLPEPVLVDPEEPLLVNGSPLEGFGWIRGFTAGVEMLGPLNWGLPLRATDGRLLGLHGAAANIPVRDARVQVQGEELRLTASFEVWGRTARITAKDRPWYDAGDPVYRLTKNLIFRPRLTGFTLHDELINLTSETQTPDWGYHVQLDPRPGCRYLVPSRSVHLRGGETAGPDHEVWTPVKSGCARVERGVVHRQVWRKPGAQDGESVVPSLLRYPDGRGVEVILPPAAYTMSWFSAGGAGSDEFMIPASAASGGRSLRILNKDWNGAGPEIGASDLDHAGDIDPAVPRHSLAPGESMSIRMQFCSLTTEEAEEREREIRAYSISR